MRGCLETFSELKTLTQVLLVFGFVLSITGTALIIDFTLSNDNSAAELTTRPKHMEQYYAVFFPLLWVCSLMAVIFRRHSTLAMSVGLLVAIVAYAYPFETLDSIRHVLDEDLSDISAVRILAAGGVSGYLGAFLSFLAPAYQHAYPSAVPQGVRIVTIGSVLSVLLGTSLLMVSATSHFPTGASREIKTLIRQIVWSTSDVGLIVVFVFNVGVWAGLPPYMWLSAAFGASQGMAALANYFTVSELIDKNNLRYSTDDQNLLTAGSVVIWLTIVVLFIASNVHVVDRTRYITI